MSFTILAEAITIATEIPNSGEKWFNILDICVKNYKSFIKGHYKDAIKKVFPFGQLLDRFSQLMRVIMKYFTCEGRFSRLYKYHVRLLMHFTGVKPLNLFYYLYKILAKMAEKVQHRESDHQAILFHHALIKFIFLHQLVDNNITWETFI